MKNYKLAIAAAALAIVGAEQAARADLANTGTSYDSGLIDQNWTVSYDAVNNGAAYVASLTTGSVNTSGYPFGSPYWLPDDGTSSWITYSNPLNITAQPTDVYTYSDAFILASTETITFRWMSDNESAVYLVDNTTHTTTLLGVDGPAQSYSTFQNWSSELSADLVAGDQYVFEIVCTNDVPNNQNPTAVRFEVVSAVPEPTTIVAGALMLLPFGIGALRSLRKDRNA